MNFSRADDLAALATDELFDDRPAAVGVLRKSRWPIGREMPVAPVHEREQGKTELETLVGEPVLMALRALLVAAPRKGSSTASRPPSSSR